MKFCNDCKISVDTDKTYCPLCGDQLVQVDFSPCIEFPVAKQYVGKSRLGVINKLIFLLSVLAIFVCVVVNVATYHLAPIWWCAVASVGVFYCWYTLRRCIMKKGNATKILFKQLITISMVILCIDFFLSDFTGWSYLYAIPLLSLLISTSVLIIALSRMLYFRDHMHYSLLTLCCGSLQLILLLFVSVKWAVLASGCASLCALVTLYIIAQKSVSGEIKKRLHL